MNETLEQRRERWAAACALLIPRGWVPIGVWMFFGRDGDLYDLSTADLSQIDRIERERLFRMEHP